MTTHASGPEGAAPARPALVRRADGRLLAGVSTGIAAHLGVSVVAVRVAFVLLSVNGAGVLGYLAAWLLVPAADPDADPLPLRRPRHLARALLRDLPDDPPHRRRTLLVLVLVGCAIGSLLGAFGVGLGQRSGVPLLLAVLGAVLIWWRAPEPQRARWSDDARRYGSRLSRRGPLLLVLGGIGLVLVGVTWFLAAHDALAQARAGGLAIGATLVGVLLVTGPWLVRLLREVSDERRERIRADERAAVAAHVHDSVLQTLALLQAKAADPDEVRRLARRQERELRGWLYAPPAQPAAPTAGAPAAGEAATGAHAPASLAAALRAAAAEVEDDRGVPVEVVCVGDRLLDESIAAVVAAAREAMLNAAKASGAPVVSVFAEVSGADIAVYVRDRGRGFDLDSVPADRHGVRDSIVGRMQRTGGTAVVRSGPGGTEVALALTRPEVPA